MYSSPTHTHTHTCTLHPPTHIPTPIFLTHLHTPLLSSTRHACTSLDLSTPLNPNLTATLVKLSRMVNTVQMADNALLKSCTLVGTEVSSSAGFMCQCRSELWPMGQVFELPLGSLKTNSTLRKLCWSQHKNKVLT